MRVGGMSYLVINSLDEWLPACLWHVYRIRPIDTSRLITILPVFMCRMYIPCGDFYLLMIRRLKEAFFYASLVTVAKVHQFILREE